MKRNPALNSVLLFQMVKFNMFLDEKRFKKSFRKSKNWLKLTIFEGDLKNWHRHQSNKKYENDLFSLYKHKNIKI